MGANWFFSQDEEQRHIGPKKQIWNVKDHFIYCVYIYIYNVLYVFKAHTPLSHIVYQQHLVSPCPSNHLK